MMINTPFATIRIGMLSGGDSKRLKKIKQSMRGQESAGWLKILFMDNEYALVRYLDDGLARVMTEPLDEESAR